MRLTDYHIPRILVVDDEDAVRAELLDVFEDEGLDAVEAGNAQHTPNLRDDTRRYWNSLHRFAYAGHEWNGTGGKN